MSLTWASSWWSIFVWRVLFLHECFVKFCVLERPFEWVSMAQIHWKKATVAAAVSWHVHEKNQQWAASKWISASKWCRYQVQVEKSSEMLFLLTGSHPDRDAVSKAIEKKTCKRKQTETKEKCENVTVAGGACRSSCRIHASYSPRICLVFQLWNSLSCSVNCWGSSNDTMLKVE